MKLDKILYRVVVIVIGVVLAVMGMEEFNLYRSGKVLDLSTATIDDFNEKIIVEGDIFSVDYLFAVYEEKSKTVGITTGKHETNYYLVESLTADELEKWKETGNEPDNYFVYVVSASSDEMKSKLNANVDGWTDYFDGKTDKYPEPVHFEGKLWQQPKEEKYLNMRNDALKELGFDTSELATLKAMDDRPGKSTIFIVIFGAVFALGGLLSIIIPFVLNKKKQNKEIYY